MMPIRTALVRRTQTAATTDAPAIDWAAIYADQLPRVYNYLRFRTGDNGLAEDLTAATFEKAWRARAQYHAERGAISTWLFTIARSVAASHFRQRRPVPDLSLAWAAGVGDPRAIPEEVQRRGDLARLHTLLARLPDRERELIELKYGAALTNRAIAALIGMSESNVGTTLHRIVHRLGHDWEEQER
ncbi:MAG: sigma-70 family RNA polymerase sigma factor [Chloroflexota bacterium]|nr:sigma-70 family RNA polymerase sigma factor [Chloroflexota bacterium]